MTEITCINCGVEGVLKVHGLQDSDALRVFRRLGRNHVSGHLHYQCPSCKMVLLVDPVLVREDAHIFQKKSPDYPLLLPDATNNLPSICCLHSSFTPTVSFSEGLVVR